MDSNSLQEFASLVAARKIETVLYSGVATNMVRPWVCALTFALTTDEIGACLQCVMERAWGMINAVKMRLNAVILKELTETAFSPYESPCTNSGLPSCSLTHLPANPRGRWQMCPRRSRRR